MIEKIIIFNKSVQFEFPHEGKHFKFEVPNNLLDEIAHHEPEEVSEDLDYGAIFVDHIDKFNTIAMLLISFDPDEGSTIIITPENYYI